MAKINREYIFALDDTETGSKIKKNLESCGDMTSAYTELRNNLRDQYDLDLSEFEKRFEIRNRKTIVEFEDEPWSKFKELKQDLEDLNSINGSVFIPPYTDGYHGPPMFRINTDKSQSEVEDDVRDYYDGLVVEKIGRATNVIISPHMAEKRYSF